VKPGDLDKKKVKEELFPLRVTDDRLDRAARTGLFQELAIEFLRLDAKLDDDKQITNIAHGEKTPFDLAGPLPELQRVMMEENRGVSAHSEGFVNGTRSQEEAPEIPEYSEAGMVTDMCGVYAEIQATLKEMVEESEREKQQQLGEWETIRLLLEALQASKTEMEDLTAQLITQENARAPQNESIVKVTDQTEKSSQQLVQAGGNSDAITGYLESFEPDTSDNNEKLQGMAKIVRSTHEVMKGSEDVLVDDALKAAFLAPIGEAGGRTLMIGQNSAAEAKGADYVKALEAPSKIDFSKLTHMM